MFNDNVGEMPLDIFADYVSDILGEEWYWEYLVFAVNGHYHYGKGNGYYESYARLYGDGAGVTYLHDSSMAGHGYGQGNKIGHGWMSYD
jgi:hypothetical protein